MTKIREHSPYARILNYHTAAPVPRVMQKTNGEARPEILEIETYETMLRNLQDLELRFEALKEKSAAQIAEAEAKEKEAEEKYEKLLAENNEFRLICFNDFNKDLPVNAHNFSIDEWPQDKAIEFIHLLEKRLHQFLTHLEKTRTKEKIKIRFQEITKEKNQKFLSESEAEKAEKQQKAAKTQKSVEDSQIAAQRKRQKELYPAEFKFVTSLMMSSAVKTYAAAKNIHLKDAAKVFAEQAGQPIPEDFWA